MLEQQIAKLDQTLKKLEQTGSLPGAGREIHAHVAKLSQTLIPLLRQLEEGAVEFAGNIKHTAKSCLAIFPETSALSEVQINDIAAALKEQKKRLDTLVELDAKAVDAAIQARNGLSADSRLVAENLNDIEKQLSRLEPVLKDYKNNVQKQKKTLNILRWIPFAWPFGELGSLIGTGKSLEQRINETERKVSELNGQKKRAQQIKSFLQDLGKVLTDMQTGVGYIENGLHFIDGDMRQILHTIDHGMESDVTIVLKAYLLTLDDQADTLMKAAKG